MSTVTGPDVRLKQSGVGSASAERDQDAAGTRALWWERIGLAIAIGLLCIQVMPEMWQRSLWLDEGYTVGAIQNLHVTFATLPGQMPLYFMAITPWAKMSLAPWWLRMPSLLASIGVLALVRPLARRLGGRLSAPLAPVLLAVSPMFVTKAIDARPYAMVELLVVVCWYCYLRDRDKQARASRPGGNRWMWLLTAAATVGPAFQALFFIQFAAIVAVAAVARPNVARLRRLVPAAVGCGGTTLLLVKLSSGASIGALSGVPIRRGLVEGYLSGRPIVAVGITALLLVGILPALVQFRTTRRAELVVPTIWLAVPVLLALVVRRVEGVYVPRYLAAIAPAVAIAVAIGVARLVRAASRVSRRSLAQRSFSLGMVGSLLIALIAIGGPRPSSEAIENWNGAVDYVASASHDGDCLVFAYKPFKVFQVFRAPFEAAWNRLGHAPDLQPVSPARPFGTVRIWDTLPSREHLAERLQSCERLWVVTYRYSMEDNPALAKLLGRDFTEQSNKDFQGEINVMGYDALSSNR